MSRSWNVSLLFTFALLLLLLLIVFQHYMDAVINRLKMTSVFRSTASHVCKLQFVVLTFYRYSWYSDTVLSFVRARLAPECRRCLLKKREEIYMRHERPEM